jgi:hypothetical protein
LETLYLQASLLKLEEVDMVSYFLQIAPALAISLWVIIYQKRELKSLKEDYQKLANRAISLMALTEERLKENSENERELKVIGSQLNEILSLIKRHLNTL